MEDRTKYLGGSDCAGVLGLSRWTTPLKIWAEKTGQIKPKDISDKICVKLGNRLEDIVAEMFCEKTGKKVRRVNETIFHSKYNFLGANIDRRLVGENTILECKTCSAWKAKEWEGEEIPQEYILQVLHYLAVTGARTAYIAVLIGNQDFVYKEVQRDEKIISDIIKKEVSFWNNFVLKNEMPMQITKNDADTLYNLFPNAEPESEIELDDTSAQLFETRQALLQDKNHIVGLLEKTDNEIKSLLKDKEIGKVGNWVATWKKQVSKRIDTKRIKDERPDICDNFLKTIESRVLRIKEIKEKTEVIKK